MQIENQNKLLFSCSMWIDIISLFILFINSQ